jgi:hypothetical protein
MNNREMTVDLDALEGLAMGTAVLRYGYTVDTDIDEITEEDWQELIDLAVGYCHWAGHKMPHIDREEFLLSVWNIQSEE